MLQGVCKYFQRVHKWVNHVALLLRILANRAAFQEGFRPSLTLKRKQIAYH